VETKEENVPIGGGELGGRMSYSGQTHQPAATGLACDDGRSSKAASGQRCRARDAEGTGPCHRRHDAHLMAMRSDRPDGRASNRPQPAVYTQSYTPDIQTTH